MALVKFSYRAQLKYFGEGSLLLSVPSDLFAFVLHNHAFHFVTHVKANRSFITSQKRNCIMFANFKFASGHQKVVVPLNWVGNFTLERFLNYGPTLKPTQVVFFSNDKLKAPNFDLRPSNPNAFWYNFDNGIDACYSGRVENVFGK